MREARGQAWRSQMCGPVKPGAHGGGAVGASFSVGVLTLEESLMRFCSRSATRSLSGPCTVAEAAAS